MKIAKKKKKILKKKKKKKKIKLIIIEGLLEMLLGSWTIFFINIPKKKSIKTIIITFHNLNS